MIPPHAMPGVSLDSARLQADLLAWFAAHGRDLPWRRHRSLYGTWISEMMLQQTTVATVVPYWERFLRRFPDVATLAAAPEEEVLALWSGLGYYRRARQLHAAARQVAAAGGKLPTDAEGWRSLPGVGPYAAGAIASLGLGLPEPAVDANVRRVLSRWLGSPGTPLKPSERELAAVAGSLVPVAAPGAWNEALMELGAVVCLPRQPACSACPVAAHCGAGGQPDGLVVADGPPGVAPAPVGVIMVAFVCGPLLWLEPAGGPALPCPGAGAPVRDDFTRLHAGLFTLPMTGWYPLPAGAREQAGPLADLARQAGAALPDGAELVAGARFRHAITRYRLAVEVVRCSLPPGAAAAPAGGRPAGAWVRRDGAAGLAVSQLARKALRSIA